MNEIDHRGMLSGRQKTRLNNLLNMMYRPSEIAEEKFGISIESATDWDNLLSNERGQISREIGRRLTGR